MTKKKQNEQNKVLFVFIINWAVICAHVSYQLQKLFCAAKMSTYWNI